jgi:hypothetical protein
MTGFPPLDRVHLQVLESAEADFEKMTWTFSIGHGNRVSGGHYAVLPTDEYSKITGRLAHAEGLLRQCLRGHLDDKFKERVESFFDPEPLA